MPATLSFAGPKNGLPPVWTVYRRPRDRPDCSYFVRLHYGNEPQPDCAPFETLQTARHAIVEAGGSFCLGRKPDDDPVIVESWI